MKYTLKMLLDEVGISSPTFYRAKRANEDFFNQHSETVKGVCSYDDEVLTWLKKEFPAKQKAAQDAPEATETPTEAVTSGKSVICTDADLNALQAKYDALQAMCDAQAQTIEELKADKQALREQVNQLMQNLNESSRQHEAMAICLSQLTTQNQQLLLNPPHQSLFSRIFGKKKPQAEQAAKVE